MTLQTSQQALNEEAEHHEAGLDITQLTSVSFCLYTAENDSIRSDQRLGPQEMEAISEAAFPVFRDAEPSEEVLVIFKRTAPPFGSGTGDAHDSRENAARKLRLAYLLRRCADRLEHSL